MVLARPDLDLVEHRSLSRPEASMRPLAEVLTVGLAAFWVFVLLARSELLEFARAPIERRAGRADSHKGSAWFTTSDRAWIKINYFVQCGWCLGAWLALAVSAAAALTGWAETPWWLLWLASAAVVGLAAERSG